MNTTKNTKTKQPQAIYPVTVTVRAADLGAHRFSLVCEVLEPNPHGQKFSLPTWIPGSYLIRDFAKNLTRLIAKDDSGHLKLNQLDKTTWQAGDSERPIVGNLVLEYDVYAFDLSVRTAWLDTERGFFNGTSVFFCFEGKENVQHRMVLPKPELESVESATQLDREKPDQLKPGQLKPDQLKSNQQKSDAQEHAANASTNGLLHKMADWRVATSMPRLTGKRYEYGEFSAETYLDFIDHPVELADFDICEFQVAGVDHIIAVSGKHNGDLDRLAKDVTLICTNHVDRFGDIPMREYWFMLALVGQGYGGLEHLDSTALLASRDDMPAMQPEAVQQAPESSSPPRDTDAVDAVRGKRYRTLLGLFSHEYFHSWNVKRIQPAAYAQGNVRSEVYTKLLWAFEGITSYFDDYALLNAGLIKPNTYLQCLAENASRVYKFSGRKVQTLEESSFTAWTKFYQQDENAPNSIVSYYAKGALVALALDLLMRRDSAKTKRVGLADVMRALWSEYGSKRKPVPETAIEKIAQKVSGLDLTEFFDQTLRSTDDYDYSRLLADYGVGWQMSPQKSVASLGAMAKAQNERVIITHTLAGSAAQLAGLAVGDELLAVDGIQLRSADWQQQIAMYAINSKVKVAFFRQGVLMEFPVVLLASTPDKVNLTLLGDISAEVAQRRKNWLGC